MTEIVERIEEAAETSNEVADQLERLAGAAEHLLTTRLTKKTLVVLLSRESGVGMTQVGLVLDALPRLRNCLKQPAKRKSQ